jgi:hypothetical protein
MNKEKKILDMFWRIFYIATIAVLVFMFVGFIVLLLVGDLSAIDLLDNCLNSIGASLGTFVMFLFLGVTSGLIIAAVIVALYYIVKLLLACIVAFGFAFRMFSF